MMTFKNHIRMTASELAMGRYMRAPEHPNNDEFAAAFAEHAKDEPPAGGAPGGDDADAQAAAAAAAAAGGAPADDGSGTAVVPPPPADGAGDGAVTPPADDAAAQAAAAAAAAPPAEDDAAKAAAAAAAAPPAPAAPPPAPVDTDALLNRMAEIAAGAQKPDDAAAAAAAAAEEPMYNADEEAVLKNFEETWPEVDKALALRMRHYGDSILRYAFKEIMGEFAPIRDLVTAMATRTHQQDITAAAGEVTDEEIDRITEWAKDPSHPKYLQDAYAGVISGGSPSEVADLVKRYREATGQAAPPPAAEPSGGEELSEDTKKAVAALAPVDSKRSVVTKTDDPDDFDGAFAKFANAEG